MLKFIIAAVALLAVAGGLTYWTLGRGDDSAEAEVQVVRWVNVTIAVPERSGFAAVQGFWGPESDPPAIFIRSLENGSSVIVIDAETGKVIVDHIEPEDRTAVDEVLQTVSVSPLDRSTAPWPYGSQSPSVPREKWGNITFIQPDPASGIGVTLAVGDGPEGSGHAIQVSNGRSTLSIDADSGLAIDATSSVLPEDKEAFDRFLSTIQYSAP